MVPAVLGLVGAIGPGLAVAPALRVLTYPFLGLTLLFLGRGWYLASLWGLRFGGLLGPQPF